MNSHPASSASSSAGDALDAAPGGRGDEGPPLPERIRRIAARPGRREPVVAGTFYPGDEETCRRVARSLLDGGASLRRNVDPASIRGLVLPHAGWVYSGRTAAAAIAHLRGRRVDRVVVVAPNHRDPGLRGCSVWYAGTYRTPLGEIPVDEAACRRLLARDEIFTFRPDAHRQEHSLEVQLPLLQEALGPFRLVPVVVGGQEDWESMRRLAEALRSLLNDGSATLLVASSDLSHYHSLAEAKRLDGVVVKALSAFDPKGLHDAVFGTRRAEACGCGPMVAVLEACRRSSRSMRCEVVEHCTSARASGDSSRVVGYVSALVYDGGRGSAMTKEKPSKKIMDLSSQERQLLLKVARGVIEAGAQGKPAPALPEPSEKLRRPCGGFVTLSKKGQLRGCIGYIQAVKPLVETVAEMAESAAFRDPRFPPVTSAELPELSIEISVLSPFRKIDTTDEVEVGLHGLHIRKGWNSGLLLPQVATEYGWDRDEFLDHTCMKAGLPAKAWRDGGCEISVFSAEIFGEE